MQISDPPRLNDRDYQQLRQEIAQELKKELRRSARHSLLALSIQASTLLFLAVLLFIGARRYYDLMLWGIGLSLLIVSMLQFLELEFLHSGRSWFTSRQKSEP
jgi:hypothetical protein